MMEITEVDIEGEIRNILLQEEKCSVSLKT